MRTPIVLVVVIQLLDRNHFSIFRFPVFAASVHNTALSFSPLEIIYTQI